MKHVTLEGGIKVATFKKPPFDFNPFAASEAELRMYGLPLVPDDPRHRARYQRVVNHMRRKLTFVEPTFRVNRDRFHGPRRRELADYGEVFFSECEAVTTSGNIVNAGSGNNIVAFDTQGNVISRGNLIAPTIVQCVYTGALPA